MRAFRVAAIIAVCLTALPAPARWAGQIQAQRATYAQALEAAQAGNLQHAYDLAEGLVRTNQLYYDANILRIALASILKKTGREDPQNLLKLAQPRFSGNNLERDIDEMINRLTSGAPSKTDSARRDKPLITITPYVRKKMALVIGIGAFKDPKINPLRYPAADARSFAETLKVACRFDEVITLVDAQATTFNIKDAIDEMAKKVTAEDLVVIYFASHGSPEDLDKAGINYIVTHDTQVDKLYATAFKMQELLNDIEKRISAERVVAFLDTCYSGGTFKESPSGWKKGSSRGLKIQTSGPRLSSVEEKLQRADRDVKVENASANPTRLPQGVGRVIIASSSEDQKSWESDEFKHGYFTYFLIETLKRQAYVSVEDLFRRLSAEVSEAVRQKEREHQTPAMINSGIDANRIYIRDEIGAKTSPQGKGKRQP
jgi:uncharacterized caspase-like protein